MAKAIENLPAEEYHRSPWIGASMIETFRKSRAEYKARYIDRTWPHKPPTPEMEIGTAAHCLILEPEKWDEVVAPPMPAKGPDGKKWLRRKGSEHEAAWQAELDKRAGKIALEPEGVARVKSIAAAVKANKRAAWLLDREGQAEFTIVWTDNDTGLECCCRLDYFSSHPMDLKTTALIAPQDYARQCVSLGYHRKRAHYLAGLAAHTGERPQLYHVAAENAAPFRVACYEIDDLDPEGDSLGAVQRRRTLEDIAECMETGDWREPWERTACTLHLPRFAWTENEYTIEARK